MIVTCTHCHAHVDCGGHAAGDVVTCACGLGILVPEEPATAGKMGCPACGGPVHPDARTCEFCGTPLATVMCPRCFGMVFERAGHCVHCGEALEGKRVIHPGDETRHACPRCRTRPNLRVEVVSGYPIERCLECRGLWVDETTIGSIYRDREHRATLSTGTAGAAATVKAPQNEGYIPCPECGKLMNRQNFGRCSGVIVDLCKSHGTWFDADELRRILEFIESGGLERQAQREREELREELRYLRTKSAIESKGEANGLGPSFSLEGAGALSVSGLLRRIFQSLLE